MRTVTEIQTEMDAKHQLAKQTSREIYALEQELIAAQAAEAFLRQPLDVQADFAEKVQREEKAREALERAAAAGRPGTP